MVNLKELRLKVKELEKKYNLNNYEVMQRFMFERFLDRLSHSKYNKNFVLKGGLYLSIVFGIVNRSTLDIDAAFLGMKYSKENLEKVLNDIVSVEVNDNISISIIDIKDVRTEDVYAGFSCRFIGSIENLKINFSVDVSTGDVITPGSIKLYYEFLFEEKNISIYSYNNETVLAEKIETILRRGCYNSRMKDYLDIYYFLTAFKESYDLKILKNAVKNTFNIRHSNIYIDDYKNILNLIKIDNKINALWKKYLIKSNTVISITLEQMVELLDKLLDDILSN